MTSSGEGDAFLTQLAVVRVLAEAATLTNAFPKIIEAVCETAAWEWGALWLVDPKDNSLHCSEIWRRPSVEVPDFESMSRAACFQRGVGLPGRVWESGEAAWISDVTEDANFPRRVAAARSGLHGALAFPIIRGGEVLGVLEFFTREIRPPNERLLALMAVTGEQIGQFMHRQRAEAALQGSEARVRAMVETALDCIVSMDHAGRVTEWNPAAERIFGYTREHALGKEMAALIIPPALRERHRRGLVRYLETGEGPVIGQRIEITGVRADGTEFPVELAITRVPGDGLARFTGFIRDITDRKAVEGERARLLEGERQARQEAERANRMKDQFLATVSHELRTPLNAILGWSQLLLSGMRAPADVDAGVETIERNARSMSQLVEEVLDVSRIITGKMRLDVRRIDLRSVMEAALAAVRPSADAKGIFVQQVLNPLAGPVMGDAGRLQQVVWNLLSNAIKFTPRGGRVQLAVERIESHVELTVTDDGEGISPDFLPHLFERFTQADATPARTHQGLGLGLAIVRHLVELHGGTVHAHSDGLGKGARFTVKLPIAAAHPPAIDPTNIHTAAGTSATIAPATPTLLRDVRVLAIDDDADARRLIQVILGGAGASVTVASSAEEGMEILQRDRPDVIVCDIGMPGEDGYSLIRRIRALPPESGGSTPAAAFTAFARSEDRRAALLAGFQMHIAKPVEPADLVAVVANLAGRIVGS